MDTPIITDANEVEIVQVGGLDHVVSGIALVANTLTGAGASAYRGGDAKRERELANIEELGAQCARALRNLSVNRKLRFGSLLNC